MSSSWTEKYRGLMSLMSSGAPVAMKTDMEFYHDGVAFQLNEQWYRTSCKREELAQESNFLCATFPTLFRPEMFASVLGTSRVMMIPWDSGRSSVPIHDPPAWHEAWCLNKSPVQDWQQRLLLRRWEMDIHRIRFRHEPFQCRCRYSPGEGVQIVNAHTGAVLVCVRDVFFPEIVPSMFNIFACYFYNTL